jgi:exosortase
MIRGRGLQIGFWIGAAALAALFLGPLAIAWGLAPDLGHGWAAPLLIGYLLWERWPGRPGPRPVGSIGPVLWIAAAAAALVSLPIRLLLIPYPVWPALLVVHTLVMTGIVLTAAWLVDGWPGVRWLGGPLTILAAAVPWPYEIQQHAIGPLREAMAAIAAEICNLLGRPAIAEGTTVHMGNAWIGIDEACGGIRSLQASVMLALFIGEWRRFTLGRRAGLVAVGVAAALGGNFLRILFLAFRLGDGLPAVLAAHDPAGWLALLASLVAIGLVAWSWSRSGESEAGGSRPTPPGVTATAGPVAWMCVVAALVAVDAGAAGLWFAHGESVRAERTHRWTVRLPEGLDSFRSNPLADEAREMLQPDTYVAGNWEDQDHRRLAAYYIEWRTGQVARSIPFLHNPTVCLPFAGCELERSLGVINVPWSGGVLPFHCYIFRQAGQDLAVAFAIWNSADDRPLEDAGHAPTWRAWFERRWTDVARARRDQPAQLLSLAISGDGASDRLQGALAELIVSP